MDEKTERTKLAAEERAARKNAEAEGFEKGFTACALLMSGRYEDYAVKRDEWLEKAFR